MADQVTLLTRVEKKLVNIPLAIDLSLGVEELEDPLYDAMREMGISDIANVQVNSKQELYLEIRVLWYALALVRNETSVYFKWSSGSDGKEVDKTKVYKAIDDTMKDLDDQFSDWYNKNNSAKTASGIYTRGLRTNKRLS